MTILLRLTDLNGRPVYLNVESIDVVELPSDGEDGGVEIDGRRFLERCVDVVAAIQDRVIVPKG